MYSSYTRENSASSFVTYEGERSKSGGQVLELVGGREILTKLGSKWDEYDSRA